MCVSMELVTAVLGDHGQRPRDDYGERTRDTLIGSLIAINHIFEANFLDLLCYFAEAQFPCLLALQFVIFLSLFFSFLFLCLGS